MWNTALHKVNKTYCDPITVLFSLPWMPYMLFIISSKNCPKYPPHIGSALQNIDKARPLVVHRPTRGRSGIYLPNILNLFRLTLHTGAPYTSGTILSLFHLDKITHDPLNHTRIPERPEIVSMKLTLDRGVNKRSSLASSVTCRCRRVHVTWGAGRGRGRGLGPRGRDERRRVGPVVTL